MKITKKLTSISQSLGTVVIIGATTIFVTLSVNGVDLVVVPISAGIAQLLSFGNKVIHNLTINKQTKYKNNIKKIKKLLN